MRCRHGRPGTRHAGQTEDLRRLPPSIVGLNSTPEKIAANAKLYGVSYTKQNTTLVGGCVIDHSAYTDIIAPDNGRFRTIDHCTPPEQVTETISTPMKILSSEGEKHDR